MSAANIPVKKITARELGGLLPSKSFPKTSSLSAVSLTPLLEAKEARRRLRGKLLSSSPPSFLKGCPTPAPPPKDPLFLASDPSPPRPLIVVKKTDPEEISEEIKEWLATESGFLEGFTSDVFGNPTSLYKYQVDYLNDKSFFIHIDKARQTGYSYIYAGRSVARSHLHQYHTSIFISINQEEANEKIVYSRGLYDSFPLSIKKKCVVDNKQSLEFEDYNGSKASRTRIISHAQREPRGKGGNVDVYLDEAAHYTWGGQIYVAAVPIITRGSGTLTIGSSPLGKKGIHYEIVEKEIYRKIYSYHQVYWWDCPDFVKEEKFEKAQREAPFLRTEERVYKFASEKLIGIYISMDIEEFQQEYELLHVDESVSFFPIDLINRCVYEITIDPIFDQDDEYSERISFPIIEEYPSIDFRLYEDLESLHHGVRRGKVSDRLYGGYDVGRKGNTGEFAIIEETNSDPPIQIVRYLKTFRDKKFVAQKEHLKDSLDRFPRLRIKIDSGGIGENIAEELSDYSWRVEPIHFSNEWKEEICSDFRIRLEELLIALPNRKDVKQQIHSIKRKVTESGRFIFDVERNKKHHGDIFWGIAMASSLGPRAVRKKLFVPTASTQPTSFPAPRIIPVDFSRSFTKSLLPPKIKAPAGVMNLGAPKEILTLHNLPFPKGL